MGAWGPGIYQDDVALDIKGEYIKLLQEGKSTKEANQEIINNNADYFTDEEDVVPAILALADIEWKYGRLDDIVKNDALKIIDQKIGIEPWQEDEKLYKKRLETLDKLKEKLESEMPPEKKVRVIKPCINKWKIGDVYAYRFESEEAKKRGLYGKYLLVIKVGETSWYPYHVIPVVWKKITKDNKIPKTEEEINNLDFLKTSSNNYELEVEMTKFFMSGTEKEARKKHLKKLEDGTYKPDGNGRLWKYREELIIESERGLYKKFSYVGNFPNINPPKNEYLPFYPINIKSSYWRKIEKETINEIDNYNKIDEKAN